MVLSEESIKNLRFRGLWELVRKLLRCEVWTYVRKDAGKEKVDRLGESRSVIGRRVVVMRVWN